MVEYIESREQSVYTTISSLGSAPHILLAEKHHTRPAKRFQSCVMLFIRVLSFIRLSLNCYSSEYLSFPLFLIQLSFLFLELLTVFIKFLSLFFRVLVLIRLTSPLESLTNEQ